MFLQKIIDTVKGNIQLNQTVFGLTLLFTGKIFFGLTITYLQIFTVFLCVTFFDYLLVRLRTGQSRFPYSGVNAGLGISFFLRSHDLILFIFAAFIAISTKHFLRINGRHFLNPSNAAVFIIIALFGQYAWVNSLQWGNYDSTQFRYYYIFALFLVLLLGNIIIRRVKKFFGFFYLRDLMLPFFLLHTILFFTLPIDEGLNSYYLFFGVPFFIHMFFMLTDPKTIPQLPIVRSLYASNIVLWFYIGQYFINEGYALLGALFVNTLFLPLVWSLEKKGQKQAMIFYLIFLVVSIILLGTLVFINGRPDLVFDNYCNKLFCK